MWLREAGWSEARAQTEIAARSELVGVPSDWIVKQERRHAGGRPDIFFKSPAGDATAVLELQLGGVDRYHLAKTAEYLARERDDPRDAQCRAILVAESFAGPSGRLAEAIARIAPIELFQMSVEAGRLVLLRHVPPFLGAILPENEGLEEYWRDMPGFELAESLFDQIMEVDPAWAPKFNRHYIGGQRFGGPCNSLAVRMDTDGLQVELKLEPSEEVDEIIARSGFLAEYKASGMHSGPRRRHYHLRIAGDATPEQITPLFGLVRRAHARWRTMDEPGEPTPAS